MAINQANNQQQPENGSGQSIHGIITGKKASIKGAAWQPIVIEGTGGQPESAKQELIDFVKSCPPAAPLVGLKGKSPGVNGFGWYETSFSHESIIQGIETEKFDGVGLKLGNGWLGVDQDGHSSTQVIGDNPMPPTWAVTSGKPGRQCSFYWISNWQGLDSELKGRWERRTEVIDPWGKREGLELRYRSHQQVLAGINPDNGEFYRFVDTGVEPFTKVECPQWIVDRLTKPKRVERSHTSTGGDRLKFAQSLLAAIPVADLSYDDWLRIGMGLQSENDDWVWLWDEWSEDDERYEPDVCQKKWGTFDPDEGCTLGSVHYIAKRYGWKPEVNTHKTNGAKVNNGQRPMSGGDLFDKFQVIRDRGLEEHKLLWTLNKLATKDTPFSLMKALYYGWLKHQDGGDPEEVRALLELDHIPHEDVLPFPLGEAVRERAYRLEVPYETLALLILGVAGSQLHARTRLEVRIGTDFQVPPVLWVAAVGESGVAKSPVLRAAFDPLKDLQDEKELEYENKMVAYEVARDKWESQQKGSRGPEPKAPFPEEVFLENFTMELLASVLGNQKDRGLPLSTDELPQLVDSMDRYRQGGDRKQLMSLYDGSSFKYNRKGAGWAYVSRTNIGITGTIQPSELRNTIVKDPHSLDGFWFRFAWINLPLAMGRVVFERPKYNLRKILSDLYQGMREQPEMVYQLSREAEKVWYDWHFEMGRALMSEPNALLRGNFPKSKERAARIALIVHCMEASLENRRPDIVISATTLQRAIKLTRWLIGQTKSLFGELGFTESPLTSKVVSFVKRFRGQGWIDAKKVRFWHSSKERPTTAEAREFMQQVVEQGFAESNGEVGSKYQIRVGASSNESGSVAPDTPQTYIETEFQQEPGRGSS